MAVSNHERVGKALELLNEGLKPFVSRELQAVYKGYYMDEALAALRSDPGRPAAGTDSSRWDTQALLSIMVGRWDQVFS